MTTSLSILAWPARREVPAMRPQFGLWFAIASIVGWALWAVAFNAGQFGDNIEQFNWAQSLQWGYHKHPPLPTWLLGAAIALGGPSPYWTYLLATLCLIGTAVFTWLIARRLAGERVAGVALLLWGLQQCFSYRVQLYNHNTVLVLCISATVWLVLRAREGAPAWWLVAGAGAGAAVLTKYQAAVPLAGVLLALICSGGLRRAEGRRGLAGAGLVMLVVIAPHAVWVANHDFVTLRYASEAVEPADLLQRLGFVLSFIANQARNLFPALAAALAYKLWERRDQAAALPGGATADAFDAGFEGFFAGLIWMPLAVLVVMALGAGVGLRNHWGVQTLQFLCIWAARHWDRRAPVDLRRLMTVALLVQGIGLAWYAAEHRDPRTVLSQRRIDTLYPARRLAEAASEHWHRATACPLKFVAGDPFVAGMAALYSPDRPRFYDGPVATPWVQADALQRDGFLYLVDRGEPLPPGLVLPKTFDLVLERPGAPVRRTLQFALRLPAQRCDGAPGEAESLVLAY